MAAVYPRHRMNVPAGLDDSAALIARVQAEPHLTYTETRYTDDDFTNNERRKELVGKLENWAKELKHVLVAVDGPAGPDNYKLGKDAEVTVLLYKNHKVVANFALAKDKLTDKEVATILAAAKKMVGQK